MTATAAPAPATPAAFTPRHATRTASFMLPMAASRAIGYFTPEGERAWAEGWDPAYLHPADGRTTAGMVFTTGHGGEHTIWTMTRWSPADGIAEYVRTTPGSRTATVLVQCAPLNPVETRVTVIYAMTALSPAGNEKIAALGDAAYAVFIGGWRDAILKAAGRA